MTEKNLILIPKGYKFIYLVKYEFDKVSVNLVIIVKIFLIYKRI